MRIEDRFRVNVPVDEAWRLLLDIERIAPCVPGAQLQEVAGDEYRGVVKVKVGPITAQYKGAARFDEVDEAAHRAVIAASGRDTRGQGNASATVTVTLGPDGDATDVSIDTDLSITGKVAQFGRGVLADVSSKLLGQFVENLERDVLAGGKTGEAGEAVVDLVAEEPEAAATTAAGPGPEGNGATSGAGVRRIASPPAEPVDLLAVSGTPVLKRLAPVLALVVVLVLLRSLRRRGRRHQVRH
jgi:uncharacterized protein